jgi:hypothetical protein
MARRQKERPWCEKQSGGAEAVQPPDGAPGQAGEIPPASADQPASPDKRFAANKASARKRKRLAEAFRQGGLDESAVAATYVLMIEKLLSASAKDTSALKLLLDALKEWSRILEPPRTAATAGGDTPSVVNLYHNVPRPVREAQGERGDAGDAHALPDGRD